MERTVKQEFTTFLTTAGHNIMGEVMRGERTLAFTKCQIGDGLWPVVKNQDDYTIDVPQQLKSPVADGLFDIDSLKKNSQGVTEVLVNIPTDFGPATINEAAWILDDGTVYAMTRYPSLPVLPAGNGGGSEVSIRAILRVGDVEQVTLIIDSGITASRQFVEDEVEKIDAKVTEQTNQLASQVSDLPVSYLVTEPTVTGDIEQSYGNNISLAISGGVSAWHNTSAAATIDHYEWLLPDNTLVNGPILTWPIPNDPVLVDTQYQFKVRAVDTEGNFSKWITHQSIVVGNRRPNIASFAHNVPSIAIKNQVVSVAFSGATDPDGDDSQITYRIINPVNVVASKTEDIVAGVALDLTFADVTQDSSAGITVVAVDQGGVQSAPQVITVALRKLAIVDKPIGLAPSNNATNLARQPQVAGSAFMTNPVGFATHNATKIRVATDFAMSTVVIDMLLGAVTSAQLDQALALNTQHWYQIQYGTAELGWSQWSDPIAFTTAAAELPQNVFSTSLYQGSGALQTITNDIDLAAEGGMVWFKQRNGANNNVVFDTLRGIDKNLVTNTAAAERTQALAGYDVTAFNQDGFSLGTSGIDAVNTNAQDYVSWAFRKVPRFFDMVKYTGDGVSGRKMPHNLGVGVGTIIVKRTDIPGYNWAVYHRSKGAGSYGHLDLTGAFYADSGSYWGGVEPTDSDFTITNGTLVNLLGGEYIAYLFAHDPLGANGDGIIACDAFTSPPSGNAVVDIGWEPQYVLWKNSGSTENWLVFDASRGMPASGLDARLNPNLSDSESTAFDYIEVTSTGFVYKAAAGNPNQSYVFMAIRAPIPV